jgi:hypothetical protein
MLSINCTMCGGLFLAHKHQKCCSKECRYKYLIEKQRMRYRIKLEKAGAETITCLICQQSFRQVGSHITQIHGMTAREYRKLYGFDVKKGQLPTDLKKLKAEQAIKFGGVKNLQVGKKYWFKSGEKGPGMYKRSAETMDRLHNMNKKSVL